MCVQIITGENTVYIEIKDENGGRAKTKGGYACTTKTDGICNALRRPNTGKSTQKHDMQHRPKLRAKQR